MEIQLIQSKIYELRGKRVMLDFDLAQLYRVETRTLNQSVKRNLKRFPDDFMFQLTPEEFAGLISQIVTSNRGGTRKLPYAFTEQGVAMLSGLLNSDVAIEVNISIMRAFVVLREYILSHASVSVELSQLRERVLSLEHVTEHLERADEDNLEVINDLSEDLRQDIDNLYNAIGALSAKTPQIEKPRNPIGLA